MTHEKRRLPRSVLLSWTCAPHHNSVQFFNLSSSRNAPRLWCFCHVHFQMCFNASCLQKCSEHVVFCTFWLRHGLPATAAWTLSTSQLPRVLRGLCVFYVFRTCFPPQLLALFRHLNFQRRSEPEVFLLFSLPMCFAPQWHAIFPLSHDQMAPHPLL